MKYFVTGASGFIGGHLVKHLRAQQHEVIALVRDPASASALQQAGVELVQGDILQKESMRAAMTGVDGLFHVAGWYKLGTDDAETGMRINVEGTRNVLELMQELSIPKAVYTSTLVVNSDTGGKVVDERYRFDGQHLTAYDRSKAQAHHEVALPMMKAGLPLVIAMLGAVYGPDDPSSLGDSLRQYLKGELPIVPQGFAIAPAHVDDIAEGLILAMEKGQTGESYILCGEAIRLVELLELAEEITGIPVPRLQVPTALLRPSAALMSLFEKILPLPPLFRSDILRSSSATYLGDHSKARRELGFQPRPLAEGLRQTLEYELAELEIQPPPLRDSR